MAHDPLDFQPHGSLAGDKFTIVKNDSNTAVVGTFTGLAEGGTVTQSTQLGSTFTISYLGGVGGHDIVITNTVTPPPPPPPGGGGGGGGAPPPPAAPTVTRISGNDRIDTAIAVSQATFPTAKSASAVVLAQGFTSFADALAGTPLAVAKGGPLLLNGPGAIDPRVEQEIFRVLPVGATVYVLGGPTALDPSIDTTLVGAGFNVVRYGGATRYDTAVLIADQGLGNPSTIFEATGLDFADALSGGAAAAKAHAAILLTAGASQAPATAAYLAAHSGDTRTALGGPAAAADPTATAIVGSDRFETSAMIASTFFSTPKPKVVGVASGLTFADALSGGAQMGKVGGPMLLVNPAAPLPTSIGTYLSNNKSTITNANLYGGTAALGDDVKAAVQTALT